MTIINKEKHFEDIFIDALETSISSMLDMNKLLLQYRAKPFIGRNERKFVASTLLHYVFLLELCLKPKYYPEYKIDVETVISAMLHKISKDVDASFENIHELYILIRNDLGENPTTKEDDIDVKFIIYLSAYYLNLTFDGEYPSKKSGDPEGEIVEEVAKLFLKVFYDFLDVVE